ncbi:MAG TPA: crotonyl-CoA carboxylase/reductase [Candidatus Elarobacter sp.]|jgi:crotonyl-CoA carboxylase/reductase|nr:crotonyl-CoA carboxylase/reductase [Candidatus Elarobacter sp.]
MGVGVFGSASADDRLIGDSRAVPLGHVPPLGEVPPVMRAWVLRRERHGPPTAAMQEEIVPVPEPGPDEVLVLVMAVGINHNGVWACTGKPVSVFDVHHAPYHIPGSDAAGIVWKTGSGVRGWSAGDEVVVHCNQDDGEDEECNGGDPMLSVSQRIWGYETPYGSFAQFTIVQSRQLLPRPAGLTWSESACYMLTLATAYRMLFGHPPHVLRPGQNVLVWGAAGGLGTMAVQLARATGAKVVGVVSSEEKGRFALAQGSAAYIDRTAFHCWGELPEIGTEAHAEWSREARRFGSAVRAAFGNGRDADIVVEHPGHDTIAISTYVVRRGGMVVICAATSGFTLTVDARHLWMRQKRIQGSHFATLKQAADANRLVAEGRVSPCLSKVVAWHDLPSVHDDVMLNRHAAGNIAALVQAHA